MIEITHTQAQRMIRLALDAPLPEAQWTALQAHLETCAGCRAYRADLLSVEQAARHALRERWSSLPGGSVEILPTIRRLRARRERDQRRLRRGGLALAIVCALALLLLRRAPSAPANPVASPVVDEIPTATVTPSAPAFRGVVVYAAPSQPNPDPSNPRAAPADLHLLTVGPAGVEDSLLTSGPADDFAPSWSPDGAWVAFLSNAERPQNPDLYDVYLISVAGTNRTRLTNLPNIGFRWPLSWSPDGAWIAAAGSDSSLYLIPTNGDPARPIADSLDAREPRFAAQGDLLAFAQDGRQGARLVILHLPSGQRVLAAVPAGRTGWLTGAFAWDPEGLYLYFTTGGEQHELRGTLPVTFLFSGRVLPKDLIGTKVNARGLMNEFSRPGWSPRHDLLFLTEDPHSPGCLGLGMVVWSRQEDSSPAPFQRPRGLCLGQQPIDLASWSQRGDWLVVGARTQVSAPAATPSTPRPLTNADVANANQPDGIYAVRFASDGPLQAERLAQVANLTGAPQVRPSGPALAIAPHPPRPEPPGRLPDAGSADAPLPPDELLARVAGVLRGPFGSQVARLELRPQELQYGPWGTFLLSSYEGPEVMHCPAISPDGSMLAYVYTRADYRSEVYVRRMDGVGRLRQVTNQAQRTLLPGAQWVYDCPAFAPDGLRLAVVLRTDDEQALQLINLAAPTAPTPMIALKNHMPNTPPRWTADGRAVLLGTRLYARGSAGVIRVQAEQDYSVSTLVVGDSFDLVTDLVLSPEGDQFAYLARTYQSLGTAKDGSNAELRIARLDGSRVRDVALPAFDLLQPGSGYGWLHWRADGALFFLFRDGPIALDKTRVYALVGRSLVQLASLTRELRGAAWSPDGEWLAFATSQGTYILNLPEALTGQPRARLVTGASLEEMDWR